MQLVMNDAVAWGFTRLIAKKILPEGSTLMYGVNPEIVSYG